jgi:hypothetical protein
VVEVTAATERVVTAAVVGADTEDLAAKATAAIEGTDAAVRGVVEACAEGVPVAVARCAVFARTSL